MFKKSLICVICFLICVICVYAQEEITITTYYPSPYGSYNELQLWPHSSPVTGCNANTQGTMYLDSDDYQIYVCDGSTWQPLSSGAPSGAVMFFNLTSCPAGWSELTDARGRYLVGLPSGGTLAAKVGTALTNVENRAVGVHGHAVNDPGHSHNLLQGPGPGLATNVAAYGVSFQWIAGTIASAGTGVTIGTAGDVAGTNAPYIQLLVCQKN